MWMSYSQPLSLASHYNVITHVVIEIKQILKSSEQAAITRSTGIANCKTDMQQNQRKSKFYQGAVLHRFNDVTKQSCKRRALADLKCLDDCMRDQLEWSDVGLLRFILTVLDTQSWFLCEESKEESEMGSADDEDNLIEIK